ncbi:hypothetical protein CONCODRAFT_2566 [Conidiobolus coronatus NRRL 28638]|uniref:Uncharacterized protein n=1 Tax=Conidiobolus coronatus (strain ATCC 28846 / CBS 209.66 / NRRL 28638) TaxID=796925 RepID=A0A137PHA3_CONC2|nr:hypothetical protein CONCODRAFT_2566 [Conidiobolus coronatus NRRL 28638]|eukprot:KXN74362.1 hypothetical protein CONCODRAFT_2566 [Conidiobolus coronatus NRRL 28638]
MYSEEIEHLSYGSDSYTHANKIRNSYFENRSCLTNVLDFLDQEVIIMPSSYFSYEEGYGNLIEDGYFCDLINDNDISEELYDSLGKINCMDSYHLSVLDNYLTIVAHNRRCIFTNKDMEEGKL